MLDDVLTYAAALGVAPLHMIVPIEDTNVEVAVTPEIRLAPALARSWIRGALSSPTGDPADDDAYQAQRPAAEKRAAAMWPELPTLIEAAHDLATLDPEAVDDDGHPLMDALEMIERHVDTLKARLRNRKAANRGTRH